MMALEPRVMFDGAAAPTAHAMHAEHHDSGAGIVSTTRIPAEAAVGLHQTTDARRGHRRGARELWTARATDLGGAPTAGSSEGPAVVFVDSRVVDAARLLAGVTPGTEIVTLQSNSGGPAADRQAICRIIARSVRSRSSPTAAPGSCSSASTDVTAEDVASFAGTLGKIGRDLRPGADILVYACDTAATPRGVAFVDALARETGHVVAASSNVTGAGGDWNLEIATGTVTGGAGVVQVVGGALRVHAR